MLSYCFQQTLTTLNLSGSYQIDDQRIKDLANALQQNKVTRLETLYFSFNHSLTIFYRHSQHWTSTAFESVIKEYNILQMPYKKIK